MVLVSFESSECKITPKPHHMAHLLKSYASKKSYASVRTVLSPCITTSISRLYDKHHEASLFFKISIGKYSSYVPLNVAVLN